jgi:hypothetical protein
VRGFERLQLQRVPLSAGRSPLVQVPETARELWIYRADTVHRRVPLALQSGRNLLRL